MNTNIQIGTSFSPEYCEGISNIKPIELLKITINELGINEIRFGLRWNKVDKGNGKISLEYYRQYIDYLLKNNCNICLNVGPIKVFRWPEEHIPTNLEREFTKDLTPETKLAQKSYEYLNNLLISLRKEYGKDFDKNVFQIENEGFNRFGHIRMLMSEEHMIKASEIVKNYFPNSKLMINSSGRTNLKKIIKTFKRLPYKSTDLDLGINFYFRLPHTLPYFQRVDFIKYSYPFDMSIKDLHKEQEKLGFRIEISEGQFEHWGLQKTPGNSYDDFEYLMRKSLQVFPQNNEKKLIRLWGIEEFALKIFNNQLTDEHKKILNSVKSFQKKS